MTEHDVTNVTGADGCHPDMPAPEVPTTTGDGDEHPHNCHGHINGTVSLHCCCPRLHSRTWAVEVGPRTEPQLRSYAASTLNAYEAAGYVVLAHSLVDAGAGWILTLTIGWYA